MIRCLKIRSSSGRVGSPIIGVTDVGKPFIIVSILVAEYIEEDILMTWMAVYCALVAPGCSFRRDVCVRLAVRCTIRSITRKCCRVCRII